VACSGVIISPQFSVSCTGYQSANKFISRLPAVFSRHWLAKHLLTSPMTAAERLRDSVTEIFKLLVLKFGTVYHLCCGLQTWLLTVSDEDLRPTCLHWCDEISALSDYWFLALYKPSLCMYIAYSNDSQWRNILKMFANLFETVEHYGNVGTAVVKKLSEYMASGSWIMLLTLPDGSTSAKFAVPATTCLYYISAYSLVVSVTL